MLAKKLKKGDTIGIIAPDKALKSEQKIYLEKTLRKNIFELEISKEIFDREVAMLVRYLHDIVFNNISKLDIN